MVCPNERIMAKIFDLTMEVKMIYRTDTLSTVKSLLFALAAIIFIGFMVQPKHIHIHVCQ